MSQVKELSAFESEVFNSLNTVKFRKVESQLQRKLKEDIHLINSERKILTFADKTINLSKLEKEKYNKLLRDAVTNRYKNANENIDKQIKLDGKKRF